MDMLATPYVATAVSIDTTASAGAYETNTLYVGNLHSEVPLASLQTLCAFFGTVEYVKVVRDKTSSTAAGYAFVRFMERPAAQAAANMLNGAELLGRALRVNWAFQVPLPADAAAPHFSIFVGDLARDVTDATLFDCFHMFGCSQARVLWDHVTGQSKRYGFVTFRARQDGDAAIAAMHGQHIASCRVRCRWAQHKQDETKVPPSAQSVHRADTSNTNVYVGNVPQVWTEADLRTYFSAFGTLVQARLHRRGCYAFVQFEAHTDAVAAIVCLHGATVDGQALKCSWGRSVPSAPRAAVREATAVSAHCPQPSMSGWGFQGGSSVTAAAAGPPSVAVHAPHNDRRDPAGFAGHAAGVFRVPGLLWHTPVQQQAAAQVELQQQLLMWAVGGGAGGGAPTALGSPLVGPGAAFY